MAGRISVTEFMKTEEAAFRNDAGRDRVKENGWVWPGYEAPKGVYFLIDDCRMMLLSARRFMTQ